VAAAVLTPPDPVSQIGLALPTIILYEIAIYCARLVERQRAANAALAEADDKKSAAASDPEGDA
jgi:sec-independent protein translocase protein TatC